MDMNGLSGLEPRGMVHLYVGDGKGKTTCATGLAVRALGAGKRVLFCQFLKGRSTGELAGLAQLGAVIMRAKCGEKFMSQMDAAERNLLACDHMDCFAEAACRIANGEFDLVVFDELIDAVNAHLIAQADVLLLLQERPALVEVVLTGRNPNAAFCEIADYHTDFCCKKHPFSSGVAARNGIEY